MTNAYDAPSHWLTECNVAAFSPACALPAQVEVVIIGGGIMGVSTAYWLARAGVDVLLLEAQALAWGATGRNAGLMLAGSKPLEDPELMHTILQEEKLDAGYMAPGHLSLASSEAVWDKIQQEALRRQQTARPVYALALGACEDLLGMRVNKRFFGGRWLPQGSLVHPVQYVYGLAAAAFRHGAAVCTQTQVIHVQAIPGQDWIELRTTRGQLRARQVVYACHTRLSEFIPAFKKVITPVRGQMMATQPLPRLFSIGLGVDWGTVYWRQADDGVIVLGGYRSLDPETETSDQPCVNAQIQTALAHFLRDTFPDFPTFQVARRWAGIMDYPADGLPIIGAAPELPNQWIIAGFGGHGLPVGLGAGKALTEAIVTGQTPSVLAPFDPSRFTNTT